MDRRSFLSKILCLGAVAAIIPKIIPKVIPGHSYILDGWLFYTDGYHSPVKADLLSVEEVLRIWRETGFLLCKPPDWATAFKWVYPPKI